MTTNSVNTLHLAIIKMGPLKKVDEIKILTLIPADTN